MLVHFSIWGPLGRHSPEVYAATQTQFLFGEAPASSRNVLRSSPWVNRATGHNRLTLVTRQGRMWMACQLPRTQGHCARLSVCHAPSLCQSLVHGSRCPALAPAAHRLGLVRYGAWSRLVCGHELRSRQPCIRQARGPSLLCVT